MFLGKISLGQAVTKLLFIIYYYFSAYLCNILSPCLVPIKLYSYTFRQLHSVYILYTVSVLTALSDPLQLPADVQGGVYAQTALFGPGLFF